MTKTLEEIQDYIAANAITVSRDKSYYGRYTEAIINKLMAYPCGHLPQSFHPIYMDEPEEGDERNSPCYIDKFALASYACNKALKKESGYKSVQTLFMYMAKDLKEIDGHKYKNYDEAMKAVEEFCDGVKDF